MFPKVPTKSPASRTRSVSPSQAPQTSGLAAEQRGGKWHCCYPLHLWSEKTNMLHCLTKGKNRRSISLNSYRLTETKNSLRDLRTRIISPFGRNRNFSLQLMDLV